MPFTVRVLSLALFLLVMSCGTVSDETRLAARPPLARVETHTFVIQSIHGRRVIEVTEAQFREAMHGLVRDVRLPQWLGVVVRELHALPAAGESFDQLRLALAHEYRAWCSRRHGPGDCIEILRDGPYLDETDKYEVAFDIALGSQWDGFAGELEAMADPGLIRVVLLGAMVSYMALLAFPELVTKGIAAALTVALAARLGAEAVWNLIGGWIQMVREVDAATTFAQFRAAGERYGRSVGAQTARILVMVVTAMVAEGGLAAKLLKLPGSAQAAAALATESGGLGLAVLDQVGTAAVAGSGITVEVVVAEGAWAGTVAMAAAGGRRGTSRPASVVPEPRRRPVDIKLKYKEGWTEEQRAEARAKVKVLSEAKNKVVVKYPRREMTHVSTKFRRAGNTIPPGCDVDHCVDLQLNGEDSLSNLWPLDSSVNRSLGPQIQAAIQNLPAGTPVGAVTIAE